MTLYVQQLAWLHAVPKAPASISVSRRKAQEERSRWKQFEDSGVNPQHQLPPVAAKYLVDHLLEVGPTAAGLGGPIDDTHVQAYQHNAGTRLAPWECRFLVRLARVWVDQSAKSKEPDCLAPYAEITTAMRARVAAQVDALLG